ncbi:MAG: hypothetical protein MUC94_11895 [bacterium]|jgi:hypothetical protein|nr:hypothetical protein [bacterium]
MKKLFLSRDTRVRPALVTGIFMVIISVISGIFLLISSLITSKDNDVLGNIKELNKIISYLDSFDQKIQGWDEKLVSSPSKIDAVGEEVEIEIGLVPGWNMISFPIEPEEISINPTLNLLLLGYTDGKWDTTSVNLNNKYGYAVYSNVPMMTLKIKGKRPPLITSIFLKKGINLVGFPSLDEQAVEQTFDEIKESVIYVAHRRNEDFQVKYFTKNKRQIKEMLKNETKTIIPLEKLRPCRSYFILVNKDVVWQVVN